MLVVASLASGLTVWAAPTTTDVPIDLACKTQPNSDFKGGCCVSPKVQPNSDFKGGCCSAPSKVTADKRHHHRDDCCPVDSGKIATSFIDHSKGDSSCSTPTPAPETVDSTCYLDESGVVGRLSNDQQAFYEPGNIAPGVVLAAGTYVVDGIATADNGDQYYRIAYSCQYLYVPLSTMGPNYDPPQNGEPLPTTPVD
ncbi:MAG TPA: hypothetical protein VHD90_19870 [Phototrophicaceae bacterium]|nr:hypothetical protein [Phototrophicaceae bacterium]